VEGRVETYEYGRIRTLARSLAEAGIDGAATLRIMEGGELIARGAKPEAKADWMAGAMRRMDALLDTATRRAVRERCACCLGGKRLEISKAIAREHESLEERIEAANGAKLVFGYGVTREADGSVLVRFRPEGEAGYRCVCLPKAREPVSITYCWCCGGHVKHHLQIALGRRLECTVRSSALSSGGKRPCTFAFRLLD
jgi:hypothetical protein